jgi:hypothetical protein
MIVHDLFLFFASMGWKKRDKNFLCCNYVFYVKKNFLKIYFMFLLLLQIVPFFRSQGNFLWIFFGFRVTDSDKYLMHGKMDA